MSTAQTPATGHGTTTIEDGVIAKVAAIAARETHGVHALGGGVARALGAIREAVTGTDQAQTQGIKVTIDEDQVSIDVTLVAAYPVPLQEVADGVRTAVTRAIEDIVGKQVAEVNVTVKDVHAPSDDTETPEEEVE
ncbi:Asp23/Gls24 family envelope stress response protein [Arachnia propionica]|nr:Asp23/Gls24 family envelope stress response protein [Arachnia propionica]MDO5082505.1 Asp23/Gls24 family envelope stress response protein [Arachnia propionica]